MKIMEGGWFPLLIGLLSFTLLTTWKRGRQILFERLSADSLPLEGFVKSLESLPPTRVQGHRNFMTSTSEGRAACLAAQSQAQQRCCMGRCVHAYHYRRHSVRAGYRPYPGPAAGHTFFFVTASYGFKEAPDVPEIPPRDCGRQGLKFDMMDTSFFLSRETLVPSKIPGMALWREDFAVMSRSAMRATDFFRIPTNRVVELGTRVEI